MVLVLSIASLALAAISAVSGRVVPRKSAPKNWDCDALEPYDKYHSRYLNFDCQSHHGTHYFDLCCHPRQANETSVPFPSQCGCDDDNDDDDSGDDSSSSNSTTPTPTDVTPTPSESPQPDQTPEPSSSTSSTPAPSPTPSPVSDVSSSNDNNNGDNSGDDNNSGDNTSTDSNTSTNSDTSTNSNTSTNDNTSTNTNSNSGSGTVYTGGEATFFYQDGNPGACGQVHSDSDFICALDQDIYGTSGNASPLCGKQVVITNTKNGNTVTVTVADDCPTCENSASIDLSLAAFQQLGPLSDGVEPISWQFA